jgi:signal transduction histidine kinase
LAVDDDQRLFESRVPADLECTTDRGDVVVILSILLSNAVDYADEGGWIEIDGRRLDQSIELTIF